MKADDWDRRYDGVELLWTADANRFVVSEISDVSPGVALDLAAGEGRNAVWLAERGWDVTAVDFSAVALERAASMASKRGVEITPVNADLGTYAPEPGRFDLVLVAYLHVPWPLMKQVLAGAAAALAPGGEVLVVGHDADNLQHGYGGPQSAAVLYNAAKVADALAGLDIEKAERVERPVTNNDQDAVAIDCLVRARRPQ